MVFDLATETKLEARPTGVEATRAPRVLVFDSGLGGLTVYPEVTARLPGATFRYVADDAVFPYGALAENELVSRVLDVMKIAIAEFAPDVVVIACHTASTLVLPPLRATWPGIDFVGTVPAIKPAAAASVAKRISVLATPGTVAREYTRDLVRTFAGDCAVTLVGCRRLASLAERIMRGEPVDEEAVAAEIAPAFVEDLAGRTDTVVLACTHYPLLLPRLSAIAPWPVRWIDPAPAIARRVEQVLAGRLPPAPHSLAGPSAALFTSDAEPGAALKGFLAARGLQWQSSASLSALPRSRTGAR
jgi:glutamate racemase